MDHSFSIKLDDEQKDRLLAKLGLQRRNPSMNPALFDRYTRPSYHGSPEEERDHIHRMSERILIHRLSGVRVSCLEEEDYDGEKVEYVIMSDFHILNHDGKRLVVLDLDTEGGKVITNDGSVAFDAISREKE